MGTKHGYSQPCRQAHEEKERAKLREEIRGLLSSPEIYSNTTYLFLPSSFRPML